MVKYKRLSLFKEREEVVAQHHSLAHWATPVCFATFLSPLPYPGTMPPQQTWLQDSRRSPGWWINYPFCHSGMGWGNLWRKPQTDQCLLSPSKFSSRLIQEITSQRFPSWCVWCFKILSKWLRRQFFSVICFVQPSPFLAETVYALY